MRVMGTRKTGAAAKKGASGKSPAKAKQKATSSKTSAGAKRSKDEASSATRPKKGATRARRTTTGAAATTVAWSEAAQSVARRIATRVLHVHFPARDGIKTLGQYAGALRSPKSRGRAAPTEFFEELSYGAVFTYAGPSCYWSDAAVGDALLFFAKEIGDDDALGIAASPFDSGALEPPTPRMRPMADWPVERREQFVRENTHAGRGWRSVFERWLLDCYGEAPERYLETRQGRHADAKPLRLPVPEMIEENGADGLAKHGDQCADRRAWLWEVRFREDLSFKRVERVLLPADRVQDAAGLFGPGVRFDTYDDALAPPEARRKDLYERSGGIQRRAAEVE